MYNSERRQFVERGYGVLKVNERHDPEEPGKLHARISKIEREMNGENNRE